MEDDSDLPGYGDSLAADLQEAYDDGFAYYTAWSRAFDVGTPLPRMSEHLPDGASERREFRRGADAARRVEYAK